jgi:4-amino-4-deoxy-L-arabinose transferase-like glycosyltransferase
MTSNSDSRPVAENSSALPRAFARPAPFLLMIALYLVWQVGVRLATSNSAELDEGEQLFMTQRLAWGYGPQPPLYTWLQYPFIQLLGPSILALALFKHLLLFGTYAFIFLSARRLTRNHLLAVAATVSLLFVPQISWESERDLTHSVLVTMMAAATLCVFLRLSEKRDLKFYLLFGLCAGLGTLSKYSFLLFFVGLIVASLTLRPMRPVILNRGMLLALALGAIIVAPHALWAIHHPNAVLATAGKFGMAADRSRLGAAFIGMTNLAGSVVVHVGALLAIYFILCVKRLPVPPPVETNRNVLRLMARSLLVIFVMLLLAMVCFRATNFKDRWLLPIFIGLPVYLAAALGTRLNPARVRIMIGIAVAVMTVVSILLPGRIWFAERRGRFDQPNAPFDRLTGQMRPAIPPAASLVAESAWLGGNLRMFFPKQLILAPHQTLRPSGREGQDCVLIWNATHSESPPESLLTFAAAVAGFDTNWNDVLYAEAPLKFYHARSLRLGYLVGRVKNPPAAVPVGNTQQ